MRRRRRRSRQSGSRSTSSVERTSMATQTRLERRILQDKVSDRISRFVPPKAVPLVTFQSVAPGTTVPRGETINVRLVSRSDVLIKDIVVEEELPPTIGVMTLDHIDEVFADDDVFNVLTNPAKLQEPEQRAGAKVKLEENLGQRLSED